ncbi:MAG TPA: Na+/H+ antiporter NhaA [Solirubrobacteraceae bacterium]|nr:Na+/H+ antiporter NhaA [Solirubrobacteraceae bacterium]
MSAGVPIEPGATGSSLEPGAAEDAPVETDAVEGTSTPSGIVGRFSGTTAWARNLEAPLRDFLRTETGSAAFLLTGAVAALVWANVGSSYERVWTTSLSVLIGGAGVTLDLREWVNSGLMTLFFFVVGLEARREFDLGDLRDRRRLMLPVAAGVGGMIVPVAIFLLVVGAHAPTGAWGTAMSTDTAFALGMLALVGRRFPQSLRAFLLTVAVVDDLVALIVIAVAFTSSLHVVALAVGVGAFAVMLVFRARAVHNGGVYLVLGLVAWVAVLKSGIDPIVVGLAMGLLTIAFPAARADLEQATDLFRLFREQPTSEQAASARAGLRQTISPNERWTQMFHPFTSYAVVPLFALANAGFAISGSFLVHAYGSAITLGVLIAYLIGKPIGIGGAAAIVTRASRGRIHLPVGWASVLGGGAIAGIGFTVSLLIATLAFTGRDLSEAKLGVLTTLIGAPLVTCAIQEVTRRMPKRMRLQALVGTADTIVDLAVPVDPERDHIRGPHEAEVTLLEYGDLECPYCGQAEPVVRELLASVGDLRYVWRHLPLSDVHPQAQLAAEATEAAALQGRFWEMHDRLLAHQDELRIRQIMEHAEAIGLDMDKFKAAMKKRKGAGHIAEDVESADLSGVSGTPTFFINGHRHQGAYDLATLTKAVKLARVRVALRT